jgi:hypothetical protein
LSFPVHHGRQLSNHSIAADAASQHRDRMHLAPACAYPLRRAVLDVTERFGLDRRVITEAEFDLAPFVRAKFL